MISEEGVVYTKTWVVDMMLRLAGYTSDKDLSKFKILEPSCGEGAFLFRIVNILCDSIDTQSVSDLSEAILAFDLNPDTVTYCRKNVSNILETRGFSSDEASYLASRWVRHGDFLLSSLEFHYDFVIGNPPYIKSTSLESNLRDNYVNTLETMTKGTDIFVGFIEKGLKSLSKDGKLCYICADRWMQNSYGKKLRKYILDNHHMDLICRMHEVDAFEDSVDAYPAIVLINQSDLDTIFVDCSPTFNEGSVDSLMKCIDQGLFCKNTNFEMCPISYFDNAGGPWSLANPDVLKLIKKLNSTYPSIEDTGVDIGIGIATGRDDVFVVDKCDFIESDRTIPLLCNKDIVHKLPPQDPKHWLVNPWDDDGSLVSLDEYPLLSAYMNANSESLMKRHVAKKNESEWYRTIDKVRSGLQLRPKLLFSDLSTHSDPIYDEGSYYPHHNLYWLTSETWDLETLGGILLSNQVESIIDAYGVKMRGKTMRFQAQYLRLIHIPEPDFIPEGTCSELKTAFRSRDRCRATEVMNSLLEVC